MQRVNRRVCKDTHYLKKEKGEFELFYDPLELKTYDDIKNKFKNFKLEDQYVNEILEENCPAHTTLHFSIKNNNNNNIDIILFSIYLEISSPTDLHYDYYFLSEDLEDELREIHDICENYTIKIEYKTIVNKQMTFDMLAELEDDEDNDEDNEEEIFTASDVEDNEEDDPLLPPPLKLSYIYTECVVCYDEKPIILNYPCLHYLYVKIVTKKENLKNVLYVKSK